MIRGCSLSERQPLRPSDVYGAPSTFRLAGPAGLPGVQALDDDVSSVTVAESLGRTDCAGWRAWLGTRTRKDLLNRAWVDREVHKDRMVWASDSFLPPAPPKVRARDRGPIDRTMPELTIHISTDTPNRRDTLVRARLGYEA
jgi:hypothetical protein